MIEHIEETDATCNQRLIHLPRDSISDVILTEVN